MNLEDEKSWSFFMPQVKLSLLAGILLQQPPGLGGCLSEAKAGGSYYRSYTPSVQNPHKILSAHQRRHLPAPPTPNPVFAHSP